MLISYSSPLWAPQQALFPLKTAIT